MPSYILRQPANRHQPYRPELWKFRLDPDLFHGFCLLSRWRAQQRVLDLHEAKVLPLRCDNDTHLSTRQSKPPAGPMAAVTGGKRQAGREPCVHEGGKTASAFRQNILPISSPPSHGQNSAFTIGPDFLEIN